MGGRKREKEEVPGCILSRLDRLDGSAYKWMCNLQSIPKCARCAWNEEYSKKVNKGKLMRNPETDKWYWSR